MKDRDAIAMLGALAQEHRIRIFRLLVRAGPAGMASSQIAGRIGIGPTGASFHLKELVRCGLLEKARDGRFINYCVNVGAMRGLLTYLTQDCCRGQPELCGLAGGPAAKAWAPKRACA